MKQTQFSKVSTETLPTLSKFTVSKSLPIFTVWGLSQNNEASGYN